ncbi:hypothetical protein WJX79_009933 [Trebouxia sp. C0005]
MCCKLHGNLRNAWKQLKEWGSNDADMLAQWAQNAFDYLAVGDYPYPSNYMLNGQGVLPAYPMRAACPYVGRVTLFDDAIKAWSPIIAALIAGPSPAKQTPDQDNSHSPGILRQIDGLRQVMTHHPTNLPPASLHAGRIRHSVC